MKIKKTIFNSNLRTPDSITVECGEQKKTFSYPSEAKKAGNWIKSIWEKEEFFLSPARVFYNIGWDADHILYCEYEAV